MSNKLIDQLIDPLKMPGQTFPLPSGGFFYKNGELDSSVINGEVQVFPMSGLAEMKFRSPDMLFSGKAVEEVIKECVPSILKPDKILSKDVDSILSFIRIVTYGPNIDLNATHSCEKAKEHSYQINLQNIINNAKILSKDKYELFFNLKFQNKQDCLLTPLVWNDAVNIMQITSKSNIDSEDLSNLFLISVSGLISSIDGTIDREAIKKWVSLAPATYIKNIQETIDKGLSEFGSEFSEEVKCKDCNEMYKLNIDLNPSSFFFI